MIAVHRNDHTPKGCVESVSIDATVYDVVPRLWQPRIGVMPHLELTEDEKLARIVLLTRTIADDRYPSKDILAKLRPEPVREPRDLLSDTLRPPRRCGDADQCDHRYGRAAKNGVQAANCTSSGTNSSGRERGGIVRQLGGAILPPDSSVEADRRSQVFQPMCAASGRPGPPITVQRRFLVPHRANSSDLR